MLVCIQLKLFSTLLSLLISTMPGIEAQESVSAQQVKVTRKSGTIRSMLERYDDSVGLKVCKAQTR